MKLYLALVAASLLAVPSFAAADDPVKGKEEKMICKREKLVGSNLPTRICMTRQEWRDVEKNAQRAMQRASDGPRSVPPARPSH
jgi:hypothetical protein